MGQGGGPRGAQRRRWLERQAPSSPTRTGDEVMNDGGSGDLSMANAGPTPKSRSTSPSRTGSTASISSSARSPRVWRSPTPRSRAAVRESGAPQSPSCSRSARKRRSETKASGAAAAAAPSDEKRAETRQTSAQKLAAINDNPTLNKTSTRSSLANRRKDHAEGPGSASSSSRASRVPLRRRSRSARSADGKTRAKDVFSSGGGARSL